MLNLPQTVTVNGSTITYTYDAAGRKLSKVSTSGSNITTTEYIGPIQYNNGVIDFIQTEEGRARLSGTVYKYEYDLKDHLGNTRNTLTWDATDATQLTVKVLHENDYYPFGLTIKSLEPVVPSPKNQYLYNGKELQDETGQYDYGARFYDPAIGRWTAVDPLAEKFESSSPYTYTYDDPIKHNDPDGMSGEVTIDKNTQTVTVSQRLVFYGGSATTANSVRIANSIAAQWNAAGGTTVIDGVKYNVKFKVRYQTVSEDVAKGAAVDDNTLNNFIRVEDVERSSFMEIGGNSGFFNINDFSDSKSTPGAHEDGHSFGLLHPSKPDGSVDVRGQGQPGIMTPRNSVVDAAFQKDPKAKPGSHPNGTIDPNKRKVTQKNINDIHLEKLKYDKDGKANLGTANHKIYDANGN